MKLLPAIVLACCLSACGGGGGGSNTPPTPPPTQRTDLLFGYFGSVDYPAVGPWPTTTPPGVPSSVEETGRHSNIIMTGTWGSDWTHPAGRLAIMQRGVKDMTTARSFGITRFIVTLDFLLWQSAGNGLAYRNRTDALSDLALYFNMIRNAGLLGDVMMVYPLDEPNVQTLPAGAFRAAITDVRGFLASQADTQRIGVFSILGPLPRFGSADIDLLDLIGIDDYDARADVLAQFDSLRPRLRPNQHFALVPGGGEPWLQDPAPFLTYANAHPDVMLIMPFIWFNTTGSKGIRENSTHDAYVHMGCLIRYNGACP